MNYFSEDFDAPSSSPLVPPENSFISSSDLTNLAGAASSAAATNRQPTPRRRRISRLYRSSHQSRSSVTSIESDVSDLTQTTRMPFKRKASSSSAKATKSNHLSSKAVSTTSMSNDLPVIPAAKVFGGNGSNGIRISPPQINTWEIPDTSSLRRGVSLLDSSDEEDEIELIDLSDHGSVAPLTTARASHLPTASMISASALESLEKRDAPPQYLSAILVMPDESCSGTNTTAPFAGGAKGVRYLPLCPLSNSNGHGGATQSSQFTIPASHRDSVRRSENTVSASNATWPLDELPVELFDLITAHLSRDDVKSMRMINREFEQKVSRSLFYTSVVPFNTELYDMIDEDKRSIPRSSGPTARSKGKQKVVQADQPLEPEVGGLMWQNAKEDKEGKVYKGHGLRVFQGFGPHIKRFGMTFEVSEKQLTQPPIKKELDQIDSYHGPYNWPSSHYARFANLAGLENTADETSKMKAAFANLNIVQELALAIESGLGWLNGPDKSMRSRIFERPSPVFGSKYDISDHTTTAAAEFWEALQRSQHSFAPYSSLKEVSLEHRLTSASTPSELEGIGQTIYANNRRWPTIESSKVLSSRSDSTLSGLGVLYTATKPPPSSDIESLGPSIVPSSLRKEQKEWLLETQWAQQAFLESYMLAVIDNGRIFEQVTSLKITKLSSRYLPMLAREVFWEALPCLNDVTLHVAADWRTVEKDNAGLAAIRSQHPSEAVRVFYKDIMRDRISMRSSIKKLNIGWFGGGEHAEGMYARNTNILPAPITQVDHCTANSSIFGLVFKYVEHLTLSNCWISPPTLEGLVKSHATKALKKLTLNSVSLTAHPRFPPANAQGAGALHLAQAALAMQAPFANNVQPPQHLNNPVILQPGQAPLGFAQHIAQLGPGFLQGANPQQIAALHQHWNQQVQHMQQLFAANQNVNMGQIPVPNHFQHLNPALVPPPPVAPQPNQANAAQTTNSDPAWIHGHREGSWPQMVDMISPGPVFDDYLPTPQPWEEQRPERPETNLRTIEFISCGYAKLLHHTSFDQSVIEADIGHMHTMTPWFRARHTNLKPLMLETRDRYIGQIVQYMRQRELDALQFAWGLTHGWSDPNKAQEAEFDGLLPGGTGRFSGTIEHGTAVVGHS